MDKKVLMLLLLMLSAAGCVNDMEYKPVNTDPQLVMNSLMTVDESSHRVYLSVSKPGKMERLNEEVTVRCYVNGTIAATAKEVPYDEYLQRLFEFDASFSSGDEVVLEAESASYKASATVTVFSEPVINQVDTVSVADTLIPQLSFNIAMRDASPGADYYSLDILCSADIDFYLSGSKTDSVKESHRCDLDCSDDLILSEDNIAAENLSDLIDFGTANRYGAFFDSQFDCKEVTLKPKVYKSEFGNLSFVTEASYDSLYVKPAVAVRVSHIGVRHYYYLKALNSFYEGMSDLALEETAIPDNVDGGIGFVGIANASSRSFSLPEYGLTVKYYESD